MHFFCCTAQKAEKELARAEGAVRTTAEDARASHDKAAAAATASAQAADERARHTDMEALLKGFKEGTVSEPDAVQIMQRLAIGHGFCTAPTA